MNSLETYQVRNRVGQFASMKLTAIKKVAYKTVKVLVISYLILTFAATLWAYKLTKETYNLRCSVNLQTVGYFTKKSVCDDLYKNWVAQSRIAANDNLINNPDLK